MTPHRPALVALGLAALLARAAVGAEDHPPLAFETQRTLSAAAANVFYAARIQNGNRVGLTLTNYGFVGTNFSSFAPSFEYPLGSSHMHMVRGGPWIGAYAADDSGAYIGVSTAATDGSAGGSPSDASEFTPTLGYVGARSTLPNSRFYDPEAISESDYIASFSDEPPSILKNHRRPLNVDVNQYTFEWSFSDYGHFVIFHYVFYNRSAFRLRDAWLGMYDELASGNMRLQSSYPPVGWFSKKLITWVDSLSMVTERYCQARAYPAQCRFDLVPEIVGVKLLGVHPGNYRDTLDKRVTFAAWNYGPGNPLNSEDSLKYAVLSAGTRQNIEPLPDSLAPGTGDPVTLIGVGPFDTVNPGDSISVDFAYIGGTTYAELARRGVLAQRAYDLDYLVPVPPPSPRIKVIPRDNALDVYWERSPEDFEDPTSPVRKDFEGYRVYVGESRDSLNLIAQYDLTAAPHDTTGFNTGLAPITLARDTTFDGDLTCRYKYTINNLRDGFKYYVAVTSYDLGTLDIESLESGFAQNELLTVPAPAVGEHPGNGVTVFPNPYRVETAWDRGQQAKDHYLWFANLPEQCSIRIYTLSGDLVFKTEFDGRTYDGSNARGLFQLGTGIKSVLPGTVWGWDMITDQGQAAATGLYLWAVEDKRGWRQHGKFLIVKSDREGF